MPLYIVAILIAISVGLVAYSLIPRKKEEGDTLRRRMAGGKAVDTEQDLRAAAKKSVARKMMDTVAPLAIRPVMPRSDEDVSRLRSKLASAGFRQQNATTLFLASKTVLAIAGLGIAIGIGVTKGLANNELFGVAVVGAALGFLAPNMWLGSAAKKRGEHIRNGLPDSLDLMVISVEAGLGLDAAIQRVGDEMRHVHPALAEELQIASLETQMGIPRSESLENLAKRCAVAELKALVAIINQAEKFGTSIGRALRNQSDALRTKRRQEAETRAQKTTVKLMAPLILFIFPAIFVVLAGPAALKVIEVAKDNPNL